VLIVDRYCWSCDTNKSVHYIWAYFGSVDLNSIAYVGSADLAAICAGSLAHITNKSICYIRAYPEYVNLASISWSVVACLSASRGGCLLVYQQLKYQQLKIGCLDLEPVMAFVRWQYVKILIIRFSIIARCKLVDFQA